MRVSVILPVYNEQEWMRIALDSLQDQTIPFELIMVDNGSTDQTPQIAREYTAKALNAKVLTTVQGKLTAKNQGVLASTGEIIVMVDGDCYYEPYFLEKITAPFADPAVVMVAGTFANMGHTPVREMVNKVHIGLLFFLFKYSPGSATAYRRDAFLQAGGYDENANQFSFQYIAFEEEVRLHWRIMHLGKVIYVPLAEAYHYRPRELCQLFGGKCPIDYEWICGYCAEISVGERF